MRKIKTPWYSVVWITIWTAAVIWFINSGQFNREECIGLILAWLVMVGVMGYFLLQYLRQNPGGAGTDNSRLSVPPARNAACPCGSGKKYKRCCGQAAGG
jgi:hypothetical protein